MIYVHHWANKIRGHYDQSPSCVDLIAIAVFDERKVECVLLLQSINTWAKCLKNCECELPEIGQSFILPKVYDYQRDSVTIVTILMRMLTKGNVLNLKLIIVNAFH